MQQKKRDRAKFISKTQGEKLAFPITAQQAQKLLKKGDRLVVNSWGDEEQLLEMLAKALGVSKAKVPQTLAKLAIANKNAIVISDPNEYDDYEEWDGDLDDLEEEESETDNLDPQYAPKGTDEVAPQSDFPSDDAEMHGGDNASQEVENGQSGEKQSSNNNAQSQNAGTDEGENGQGSGSGLQTNNKSQEDSGAEQSDRPETGSTTSGDAANFANPRTPHRQKAGTSESEAGSESGEGTATSPVSEIDGKTMPVIESDRPRDGDCAEPQENRAFCESQVGEDSVNPEGQVKASEEVCRDKAKAQGQPGDLEDNQDNSFVDDELDWETDIPNSKVEQMSDDVPAHQKKWGKSFSKQERQTSKLSVSACSNHGGINASLAKAGISPKLAKECQRKLTKLIGDATTETSPRRDYQEFCVRIQTLRNPNPARKEETGRPVILIMADVSGSCSSFSDQSVMVAKAASKLGVAGSDVIVLTHSNGYPCELEHNGKPCDLKAIGGTTLKETKIQRQRWNSGAEAFYNALIEKYQIAIAIALGDWDASDYYWQIAENPRCEKFIWLDNAHCSSRGFVKDETKMALEKWADEFDINRIRYKLTYKTGCKNALAFVKEI